MVASCIPPVFDMEEVSREPKKMVEALEGWGCFRLTNHGIPLNLMSEMKATVLSLFELPVEIKQRNVYPEPLMGYVPVNVTTAVYDALGVFDMANPGAVDQFCDQLEVSPRQREIMSEYSESVKVLAHQLGIKIRQGYGLSADDSFKGWSCQLRMNRYCNNTETIGSTVGATHSDKSFLTILQDDEMVDGLEILDDHTGEWIPIHPMPGSLLVNTGDIAKAWSNGRLCNVTHRIQSKEPKVRVSTAYFVLGPWDTKLEAPPELVDSEHHPLYVPFNFEEYRKLIFSGSKRAIGGALEFYKYAK